jgi:hypothetical protein
MMIAIVHLLGMYVADLFKSRQRLEVESLFPRHQLNIVLRRTPQRLRLRGGDRALLIWMTRRWPSLLGLARVVQPDKCGDRRFDSRAIHLRTGIGRFDAPCSTDGGLAQGGGHDPAELTPATLSQRPSLETIQPCQQNTSAIATQRAICKNPLATNVKRLLWLMRKARSRQTSHWPARGDDPVVIYHVAARIVCPLALRENGGVFCNPSVCSYSSIRLGWLDRGSYRCLVRFRTKKSKT